MWTIKCCNVCVCKDYANIMEIRNEISNDDVGSSYFYIISVGNISLFYGFLLFIDS